MSALTELASAAASIIYNAVNQEQNPGQLDQLARSMWQRYYEGAISEGDATVLASCIERRRFLGHRTAPAVHASFGPLARRNWSRFKPRRPQRSPNREASRNRRRMLGGSSALPDDLRHHYTEGQRSMLCIVAGEVKRHGICDLPIDKITALAGVCRTTVQNAMHEARRLRHVVIRERPVPGRKSLTNVIEVVSSEWRAWIRRAPSAARLIGSNPMKTVSTTKIKDRKEEAFDEENASEAARRHTKQAGGGPHDATSANPPAETDPHEQRVESTPYW